MSPNRWGTVRLVVGSGLDLEINPDETCRIYDGPNREPLAELSNCRLLAALLRFAKRKPLWERVRDTVRKWRAKG